MAKHAKPSGFWCKIKEHSWMQYVAWDDYSQTYKTTHYQCDRCKQIWS